MLDRLQVEVFRLALQGFSFTFALWLLDQPLLQLHTDDQLLVFGPIVFATMVGVRFVCCLLVPVQETEGVRERADVLMAEMMRTVMLAPVLTAYTWFQFGNRDAVGQVPMLAQITYWVFITNALILLFWFLYSKRELIKRAILA